MARDYPYNRNPMSAEEKRFWTKLKVFFFCDEDESLHWSDIAWMVVFGVFVVFGVVVACS